MGRLPERVRLNALAATADNLTMSLSLVPREPPAAPIRVSELLSALSFALDLADGQRSGHTLRSSLIGIGIADRLGLPLSERRDLYLALLLKDVGCSSNAARVHELFGGDERRTKSGFRRTDWRRMQTAVGFCVANASPGASWFTRFRKLVSLAGAAPTIAEELVAVRCPRSEVIVVKLGFGAGVAGTLGAAEEHWDGGGHPRHLAGDQIPLSARILSLAQIAEVFLMTGGPADAIAMARDRSKRWFDPELVALFASMERELAAWGALDEAALQDAIAALEPGEHTLLADEPMLDRIAEGFAEVVDAKSPFTGQHSHGVAAYAVRIARELELPEVELAQVRRAALLHDIGKLSVPNSILDKPARLTADEWETVRLHPYYTQRILERVEGFAELARVASAHHERLDGRGYFRGLRGSEIPPHARILAVADIFEALTAARPYRPALPEETALRMLDRDRGIGVDSSALDALVAALEGGDMTWRSSAA